MSRYYPAHRIQFGVRFHRTLGTHLAGLFTGLRLVGHPVRLHTRGTVRSFPLCERVAAAP